MLETLIKLAYVLDDIFNDASSGCGSAKPIVAPGSKYEPTHIKYGPNMHYGIGRYGEHVLVRKGKLDIHIYRDKIFVSPSGKGTGIELKLPEEYMASANALIDSMAPAKAAMLQRLRNVTGQVKGAGVQNKNPDRVPDGSGSLMIPDSNPKVMQQESVNSADMLRSLFVGPEGAYDRRIRQAIGNVDRIPSGLLGKDNDLNRTNMLGTLRSLLSGSRTRLNPNIRESATYFDIIPGK